MKQGLPMPFLYILHLPYILSFVPVSQLMYVLLYLDLYHQCKLAILLLRQNDTGKHPNNLLRHCLH